MGKFSCPIDTEGYIGYDCRKCIKYKKHILLLRRFGKRATCRVAVTLRANESEEVV